MGIDIYAKWRNQTVGETEEQEEAWSNPKSGEVGYLREAYSGEPYATRHLFTEAFETGEAETPTATLRARLDHALLLTAERERKIYHSSEEEIEEVQQSLRDFVALCERKEAETGEPVLIIASY